MIEDISVDKPWLMLGDCLERMNEIPNGSIDMVLCDMPYGTTDCKWDEVIELSALWRQYRRIVKKNGAIVLTATQPFTSMLISSNIKNFKTSWVWNKKISGGFATAKYHPLKITEDVCVFCYGTANYYPVMRKGKMREKNNSRKKHEVQSGLKITGGRMCDDYYPTNIVEIANGRLGRFHATQKPVELMEYFVRTYSTAGSIVLDNCFGSGTTGVACLKTGRRFVGIELDEKYFEIGRERIFRVLSEPQLVVA